MFVQPSISKNFLHKNNHFLSGLAQKITCRPIQIFTGNTNVFAQDLLQTPVKTFRIVKQAKEPYDFLKLANKVLKNLVLQNLLILQQKEKKKIKVHVEIVFFEISIRIDQKH